VQVEVVVPGVSEHGLPVKLPLADPFEKLTVPPGADFVPEPVSDTTTVQVVDWLIATVAGEQPVTEVDVPRLVTVNPEPVASLLPACTESVGV
jgi:hypothetical protein